MQLRDLGKVKPLFMSFLCQGQVHFISSHQTSGLHFVVPEGNIIGMTSNATKFSFTIMYYSTECMRLN